VKRACRLDGVGGGSDPRAQTSLGTPVPAAMVPAWKAVGRPGDGGGHRVRRRHPRTRARYNRHLLDGGPGAQVRGNRRDGPGVAVSHSDGNRHAHRTGPDDRDRRPTARQRQVLTPGAAHLPRGSPLTRDAGDLRWDVHIRRAGPTGNRCDHRTAVRRRRRPDHSHSVRPSRDLAGDLRQLHRPHRPCGPGHVDHRTDRRRHTR